MIALVTGATGFIGSHLVEALLQKGLTVRALTRKTSNLRWLKDLRIERVFSDLRDSDFPRDALREVDYIFHGAGIIEGISRRDYFEANCEGTRRLLEAAARTSANLKKFIFISSQAAGGPSHGERGVREEDPPHPVSFYGESKLAAEKAVLDFKNRFPTVILRPPTIYGPRETRVYKVFQMMQRGFALAPGFKSKRISFCYVNDLIEALLLAAFKPQEGGRIYNVAGENPIEWVELVEAVSQALRRSYRLFRVPSPVLLLFGAGGEVVSRLAGRPTLFTWQKVKEFVQNSWVIDGARIRQELDWQEKTALTEGISKTAEWYRREGWL